MNKKKKIVSPTLAKLRELREIEYKREVPLKRGGKKKEARSVSLVGFNASLLPDSCIRMYNAL